MVKHINKIVFAIALFLFSYTAYRALVLSFTWDEAFSYLQFVRHGITFPEKYEAMDANNHILNTWLNIHFVKFFGVSELVLRLPSLFAHVFFLYYSFLLVKSFQNKWLVLASFLVLNLNPYMLDFFSLSRGYGLSLGLMMASIYYLYAYLVKGNKIKDAVLVCLFAALAALGNFVILNYFVVASGLLLLLILRNSFQNQTTVKSRLVFFLRAAALPLLIFFFAMWMILPVALKLKDAGALFYGGNNGFWSDTLGTITDRSFYELGYNYWFQRAAKGFAILIVFAGVCFTGIKLFRKEYSNAILFLGSLLFLILFCSLSTIVQHYLFGTLYLIDRTALFLAAFVQPGIGIFFK